MSRGDVKARLPDHTRQGTRRDGHQVASVCTQLLRRRARSRAALRPLTAHMEMLLSSENGCVASLQHSVHGPQTALSACVPWQHAFPLPKPQNTHPHVHPPRANGQARNVPEKLASRSRFPFPPSCSACTPRTSTHTSPSAVGPSPRTAAVGHGRFNTWSCNASSLNWSSIFTQTSLHGPLPNIIYPPRAARRYSTGGRPESKP